MYSLHKVIFNTLVKFLIKTRFKKSFLIIELSKKLFLRPLLFRNLKIFVKSSPSSDQMDLVYFRLKSLQISSRLAFELPV